MMIDTSLHPKFQKKLIGHDNAWKHLTTQHKSNRLHPAWILSGQKGIGKTTFAYQFARYLLGEGGEDPTNAAFYNTLIDQGAHPNLLTIERQTDEDGNLATEIKVQDLLPLRELTQQSASLPGWRVIIIDSLEDLNRNAANALLKILEEPPSQTLFLSICHSLGQILPTIRSRCCVLPFHPLDCATLQDLTSKTSPLDSFDKELANGSIGRLQIYQQHGGANTLFKDLEKLLKESLKGRVSDAISYATSLDKNDTRFSLIQDLLKWTARRIVLLNSGIPPELPQDHDLLRLTSDRSSEHWLRVQQVLETFLRLSKGAHLSQTHVLQSCFIIINNPNDFEELTFS